ncbi:MAG TPA: site-2 protease family protein [Candidatus Moranbacteria bacterium]|nr:site-2 protease family protein [Candidatus Moranbacteria bacterium]
MPSEIVLIFFYIVILLYSVIVHEVAHGVMALWLGDSTAKYAGRLNLNPIKHIDLWGSIIAPVMMLLLSNFRFAFGWAKPVPYNPYNLKNQKWGPALVAFSGPLSNILLALIFTAVARLIAIPTAAKADIILNFNDWSNISTVVAGSFSSIMFELCIIIIFWNVLLAFFNLIPIPPLDGSKLLFSVFPIKIETQALLEQFGFIFLLFFVIFFSGPMGIFLNFMLNIFLGMAL